MSWFIELADKAETLLNKIDQNAAAILQEKDKRKDPYKENLVENVEMSDHESKALILKSPNKFDSFGKLGKSLSKNKTKNATKVLSDYESERKDAISVKDVTFNNYIHIPDESNDEQNQFDDNFSYEMSANFEGISSKLTNDSVDKISDRNYLISPSSSSNTLISGGENGNGFDIENAMLKNEISVVHTELSILLSKAKSAEKLSEDTHHRLIKMEKMYNDVVRENEILHKQIQMYKKQLNDNNHTALLDSQSLQESEVKLLNDKLKDFEFKLKSVTALKLDLENDLKMSQNMCIDLEEKLEKAKAETAKTVDEWKNYKIRVNNTLLMKEKMIEDLEGNQGISESETMSNLNSQINELKTERNELVEELSILKSQFDVKRREIDQLELNLRLNERQTSVLRDSLRQEKSMREMAEHTVNSLSKELQTLQAETAKQISSLRVKIKENSKGSERQFSNVSYNTSESGEERLRSLTQALVAKQAALESVTTDRNALRLQLEKTENKYRSDLVNMKNNKPRIIDVNYTDDVKERFPSLLQESPWDSRLSRHVKKAYSSLDSFGVRIGVFLRRNPVARIFIIAYMIILHLWVLFILGTYTPEIH